MDQFRRNSDNYTPPPIIMRESAFSRPILPVSSSLLPPKPLTGAPDGDFGSGSTPPPDRPVGTPGGGRYRECLRNHSATHGGKVVDGCGEFISVGPADPIKCAACGCHRSFHRRDPDDHHNSNKVPSCHRLLPPPPPPPKTTESSSEEIVHDGGGGGGFDRKKKRFRTKFSSEQKGKMMSFAERVKWRVQKKDEVEIESFCREIGVPRQVLKVWLHNNKHLAKKHQNQPEQ